MLDFFLLLRRFLVAVVVVVFVFLLFLRDFDLEFLLRRVGLLLERRRSFGNGRGGEAMVWGKKDVSGWERDGVWGMGVIREGGWVRGWAKRRLCGCVPTTCLAQGRWVGGVVLLGRVGWRCWVGMFDSNGFMCIGW